MNLPPETPQWAVLAVAVAIAFKYLAQFLSEASESVAKLLGPLGRRWRERGEERLRERVDTDPGRVSAITSDRDYYKGQVVDLTARAKAAEDVNTRFMDWYSDCDQPFHQAVRIAAAESGCDLPDWTPLSRWEADAS